jgi:hypothetical protein
MLHHNHSDKHIHFVIDQERYEVPPGAEVDIPRMHAYVIPSRGLPLTKGSAPGGAAVRVESDEAPPPPPPRLLPGVETGPRAVSGEDDDGDEGEEESDEAAEDAAAAGVADQLKAQGVAVPAAQLTRAQRRAQARASQG